MKQILPTLLLFCLPAAALAAGSDPGPYAFFAPLIGHSWISPDFNYRPGHLAHQESTYSWSSDGQGVRGDLYLYEGKTLIDHEIDSIVWNPSTGRFVEKDGDTLGNVKTGTSRVLDGVLVDEISISSTSGAKAFVQSRLTLAGDTMVAKFFHRSTPGDWVQFLELKLTRKPG